MQTKTVLFESHGVTAAVSWSTGTDTGQDRWQVELSLGGRPAVPARIEHDRTHGWGFAFTATQPDAPRGIIQRGLTEWFLPAPEAREIASGINNSLVQQLEDSRDTPLYFTVVKSSNGTYILKPSKPATAIGPYGPEKAAFDKIVGILGQGLPAGRLMPPLRPGQRVEVDMLQWLCKRLWAGRRFSSR